MKINDTNRLSQVQKYQQAYRASEKDANASASTFAKQDGVSISSEALEMAREVSQSDGAERAQRMEEVKRQLQDGSYQVETNAVVRKMLEAYGEF